jgi:hypothetical protein
MSSIAEKRRAELEYMKRQEEQTYSTTGQPALKMIDSLLSYINSDEIEYRPVNIHCAGDRKYPSNASNRVSHTNSSNSDQLFQPKVQEVRSCANPEKQGKNDQIPSSNYCSEQNKFRSLNDSILRAYDSLGRGQGFEGQMDQKIDEIKQEYENFRKSLGIGCLENLNDHNLYIGGAGFQADFTEEKFYSGKLEEYQYQPEVLNYRVETDLQLPYPPSLEEERRTREKREGSKGSTRIQSRNDTARSHQTQTSDSIKFAEIQANLAELMAYLTNDKQKQILFQIQDKLMRDMASSRNGFREYHIQAQDFQDPIHYVPIPEPVYYPDQRYLELNPPSAPSPPMNYTSNEPVTPQPFDPEDRPAPLNPVAGSSFPRQNPRDYFSFRDCDLRVYRIEEDFKCSPKDKNNDLGTIREESAEYIGNSIRKKISMEGLSEREPSTSQFDFGRREDSRVISEFNSRDARTGEFNVPIFEHNLGSRTSLNDFCSQQEFLFPVQSRRDKTPLTANELPPLPCIPAQNGDFRKKPAKTSFDKENIYYNAAPAPVHVPSSGYSSKQSEGKVLHVNYVNGSQQIPVAFTRKSQSIPLSFDSNSLNQIEASNHYNYYQVARTENQSYNSNGSQRFGSVERNDLQKLTAIPVGPVCVQTNPSQEIREEQGSRKCYLRSRR